MGCAQLVNIKYHNGSESRVHALWEGFERLGLLQSLDMGWLMHQLGYEKG